MGGSRNSVVESGGSTEPKLLQIIGLEEDDKRMMCIVNYRAIVWQWGEENFGYVPSTIHDSKLKTDVLVHSPILPILSSCDLALASDVVYDPAGYEPLLKSITDFLNAPYSPSRIDCGCTGDRTFIMAHRHRNPEDYR